MCLLMKVSAFNMQNQPEREREQEGGREKVTYEGIISNDNRGERERRHL